MADNNQHFASGVDNLLSFDEQLKEAEASLQVHTKPKRELSHVRDISQCINNCMRYMHLCLCKFFDITCYVVTRLVCHNFKITAISAIPHAWAGSFRMLVLYTIIFA